ncbi:MAG: amidohydrolase family protein, partial [Spirochaetota bacterium]
LDEYVGLCRELAVRWRSCGAVCMKDQSAYTRSIAYRMPTTADAEREFNAMLEDPRSAVAYDATGGALSDYLMHAFMRIAREMDLPVQLHTGHMAGTWNDVAKANAANLRTLLEVHRDVRFDLFHANWPYAGDLLFLAKNYPNVSIDFCWAHQVDPVYSQRMLVQSVASVPYTKIHGFGSDVGGDLPHLTWAYAKLARDGIASALAELVDGGYLGPDDARELAVAWLYENPRAFFRLDLPPARVEGRA